MLFGLLLIGIIGGVGTALLLRSSVLRGENPTFILALPEFRMPNFRNVATKLLDRVRVFLGRAGTVIFAVAVVVWALTYFPRSPDVEADASGRRGAGYGDVVGRRSRGAARRDRESGGADHLEQSWLGRGGQWVEPVVPAVGLGLARLGRPSSRASRHARLSLPCSARSTPSAARPRRKR